MIATIVYDGPQAIADIIISALAAAAILGCFVLWLRVAVATQRIANLEAHNAWLHDQVEIAQRHARELLQSATVAWADNDALRQSAVLWMGTHTNGENKGEMN